MPFEVFTRKNLHSSRNPTVTVTSRGGLSLNRAAFEVLGEPGFVQLLIDRDNDLLGIKRAHEYDDNAYAVNRSSRSINAIAFVRHAQVAVHPGTAWRWPAFVEGDVLCWSLSKRAEAVTSNRAKDTAVPD